LSNSEIKYVLVNKNGQLHLPKLTAGCYRVKADYLKLRQRSKTATSCYRSHLTFYIHFVTSSILVNTQAL